LEAEIDTSTIPSFVISLSKWFSSMKGIFLMLSLIQGFFAGVIIGKLSEGELSAGLRHSLILMTVAFFVMTLMG